MGDANLSYQQPDEWRRMTRPFIFLRLRPRVLRPLQTLHTAHHWSPCIELRLLEHVIEKRESMIQHLREQRLETHIREREKMLHRLANERVRTENTPIAAANAAPAAKNPPLPIANLVARPLEYKLNRALERKESGEAQRDERAYYANSRNVPPPQLDMNALTDQVMRQMDRKLQAHRERMWRK